MSDIAIQNAIRQLAGVDLKDQLQITVATVESVDLDSLTCECRSISSNTEGVIPGVHLMAEVDDGVLYVPSKGSTVILIDSIRNEPYIIMYSQLDQILMDVGSSTLSLKDGIIQFNQGENGGLTITPELRTQLQKTNTLLQSLINIITGAPIPEPGNGSPSALQAALSASIFGMSLGSYDNIENNKITH